MRFLFSLMFFLLLAGCVHEGFLPEGSQRERMFPNGTYHHAVDVEIDSKAPGTPTRFHFTGIVQISDTALKLVALGPFGTTLFRVDEDRATDHVEFKNYIESLEKYQDQFQDYFEIVRVVLLSPFKIPDEGIQNQKVDSRVRVLVRDNENLPTRIKVQTRSKNQRPQSGIIEITKYDSTQLPVHFEIKTDRYSIMIKVSDYER